MKSQDLFDAVGQAPDDLLERAADRMETGAPRRRINTRVLTVVSAAVLAAALLLTAVAAILQKSSDTPLPPDKPGTAYVESETLPPPPIGPWQLPEITLSASEVGSMFNRDYLEEGATNRYIKVYADRVQALGLSPLPDADCLPIYRQRKPESGSGEAPFRTWVDKVWAPMMAYLGIPEQPYTVNVRSAGDYSVKEHPENGTFRLYVNGSDTLAGLFFYPADYSRIRIDGQYLSLTRDTTDEAAAALVAGLAEELNRILGTNFIKPRVVRSVMDDGKYSIYVIFENPDNLPPAGLKPLSYLQFAFSGVDWTGTPFSLDGSDGIVYLARISVRTAYLPEGELYTAEGRCRRLTLEEAEQELYAGHVFGGHTCPLCQAEQEEVSFRGYDAVGFTSSVDAATGRVVPFYTFYKYIGQNEYGVPTYAKTYVCAVPLEGYDTYLKAQKKYH